MITPVQRRSAAARKARASQKAAQEARQKSIISTPGGVESSRGGGEGVGAAERTTGGSHVSSRADRGANSAKS